MSAIYKAETFINAVERQDWVLLQKIILLAKNVNFKVNGEDNFTLLHIAAGMEDEVSSKIVEELLKNGANPNAKSSESLTPVHISVIWCRITSLRLLLSYGGDPTVKDIEGKNALDMALENANHMCFSVMQEFLCKNHDVRDCFSSMSDAERTGIMTNDSGSISSETESVLNSGQFIKQADIVSRKRVKRGRQHDDNNSSTEADSSGSTTVVAEASSLDTVTSSKRSSQGCLHKNSLNSTARSNLPAEMEAMSNQEIFDELKLLGDGPGPVMDYNRNLYLHRLAHLKLGSEAQVVLHPGALVNCTSTVEQPKLVCEVVHVDEDKKIAFLEHHYPTSGSDSSDNTCNSLILDVHPHPKLQSLSNERIFWKLKELNDNPGPITDNNRNLYLRRLTRLLSGASTPCKGEILPSELSALLKNELKLHLYQCLETEMTCDFNLKQHKRVWREGNLKMSFNYLLLDPRITKDLPGRASSLSVREQMTTYIKAVFYIGKGKRSRPYSHLYEALESNSASLRYTNSKVKRILEIWQDGYGVIALHVFQNVIPVEAYTRETCMIEVMGLGKLTNQKLGECYGVVASWTRVKKKKLGAYLLYRSMNIFLNEGERHLKPIDLVYV